MNYHITWADFQRKKEAQNKKAAVKEIIAAIAFAVLFIELLMLWVALS